MSAHPIQRLAALTAIYPDVAISIDAMPDEVRPWWADAGCIITITEPQPSPAELGRRWSAAFVRNAYAGDWREMGGYTPLATIAARLSERAPA